MLCQRRLGGEKIKKREREGEKDISLQNIRIMVLYGMAWYGRAWSDLGGHEN